MESIINNGKWIKVIQQEGELPGKPGSGD